VLKIDNLSVRYGHVEALRDISLEVKEHEIVTLIGSNGAGKTTTLMAISSLAAKDGGRIEFAGTDITNLSPEKVVNLGLAHVPEGRRIFPSLTVYENLLMGTLGNKKLTKAQITELVDTQFALFPRLSERRSQVGGSLSGGEQQMLAVARGLMMNPQMVMLDEPSLGLAPIIVEEIFELILKIRAMGKTVLLIEQNASMALSIADRGYVIANGRVLLSGTGDDLLNNEDVKKAYLGV
jgi:branched-chain amino acid transport system ATP-binding protein